MIGPRPTAFAPRSKRPAGRSSIEEPILRCRRSRPPISPKAIGSDTGPALSVPSRLDEPAVGVATVVIIATDWPADLARALAGLRSGSPDGTSIVVVANAPSPEQTEMLETLEAEVASRSPRGDRLDERAPRPRDRHEHRTAHDHRTGRGPARHERRTDR